MVIADVVLTLAAPIRFVKRDLVTARNALNFLVTHKDSVPE